METEAQIEARTRREIFALAEDLAGVENEPGWKMEAHSLRTALIRVAVAYPAVSDEEMLQLVDAVREIVPLLKPSATK